MLLHGIFPAMTTPFYSDGNVYFKKLEHNVERYSKTPVAGLVVLGSTGESIMLSDEERREVLKTARESAAPNKVLIAGTGIESAVETLKLTEYAAELGYDVALVRTPHFYKKQMLPANLLAFYRTVADRSPLPVLIYNVPPFTGYDMDGRDAPGEARSYRDGDVRGGNAAYAEIGHRWQWRGRGTGARLCTRWHETVIFFG